jgi:hypothetical protein
MVSDLLTYLLHVDRAVVGPATDIANKGGACMQEQEA